jgi:hypothetical protein
MLRLAAHDVIQYCRNQATKYIEANAPGAKNGMALAAKLARSVLHYY